MNIFSLFRVTYAIGNLKILLYYYLKKFIEQWTLVQNSPSIDQTSVLLLSCLHRKSRYNFQCWENPQRTFPLCSCGGWQKSDSSTIAQPQSSDIGIQKTVHRTKTVKKISTTFGQYRWENVIIKMMPWQIPQISLVV